MKAINVGDFTSNVSPRTLLIFTLIIFSVLFWKDAGLIGPTEDEGYICERNYRVLDINRDYSPSFKKCEEKHLFFKIISQNFPPVYSVSFRNAEIPIVFWPHITSFTYIPQKIFIVLCGFMGRKNLFTCEIVFNFVLVCLTLIVIFILVEEIYGKYTALLSVIIYSTFTSTRFFSYIGISIDFIFHTLYFWTSLLFMVKFQKKEKRAYLFMSSVFCAFCLLSYLKVSSFLALCTACVYICKEKRAKNLFIFSVVPVTLLTFFYVIPSIHVAIWNCPKSFTVSTLTSTTRLIEEVLKFYELAINENKGGIFEDVFRMIDFTGYGSRLKYKDNLSFSLLPSLPFLVSIIFCLLKREGRKILFFFALYDILLFFDVPVLGLHRKLRPLMPIIAISIAFFITGTANIKNISRKILFTIVIISLTYQVSLQLFKMEKIIESIKKSGYWSIKTSYKAQKELINVLTELREKGENIKIVLFSGVVNFDLLTNCRKIIDEDFSYLIHFAPIQFQNKLTEIIYKSMLKDIERKEIYIISDRYGLPFLKEKEELDLTYSIGPKDSPVFFIFRTRADKKEK